jgi:hypothetical protein
MAEKHNGTRENRKSFAKKCVLRGLNSPGREKGWNIHPQIDKLSEAMTELN